MNIERIIGDYMPPDFYELPENLQTIFFVGSMITISALFIGVFIIVPIYLIKKITERKKER